MTPFFVHFVSIIIYPVYLKYIPNIDLNTY